VTSIALGLACLGCVLLSLSLRRHYKQVFADQSTYERRCLPLRVVGYACVLLSLLPCVAVAGWGIGLVLWSAVLALAAMLQALLLTYRPQDSARFGGLSLLLIVVGIAI
jgi:hypothetical protein